MAGAGGVAASLPGLLRGEPAPTSQASTRQLVVDCANEIGRIKPLHGINNGPFNWGGRADLTLFHKEAGFPYVRLHDVHWPSPDVVDIPTIFPLFHADADDPANYLFAKTDTYLKSILDIGEQIIYRLGVSIEHFGYYHTHPPLDFAKWAKICVNIIRHYNEGWANGFHYNIRYWEVWNEPNIGKNMWSGTREQYFDLYATAAKAIKAAAPYVKVGGPAIASPQSPWVRPFLQFCRDRRLPLDFFSWHRYTASLAEVRSMARLVRGLLDEFRFKGTESHYNEWHYLNCRWDQIRPDDARDYVKVRSLFEATSGPQGAAFCAAVLMLLQDAGVDVANYYTGDTSRWGLFDEYGVPRKTYYAFRAFNELSKTPRRVACELGAAVEGLMACAGLSADGATVNVLISNSGTADAHLDIAAQNLPWKANTLARIYRVDAANDFALTGTQSLDAAKAALTVVLPKPSVCLISFRRG
jgi:xylan 1,4-beta-xylosidase